MTKDAGPQLHRRPPDLAAEPLPGDHRTSSPPCETQTQRRPLSLAVEGQQPLCSNCHRPQTTSIEISQMVSHDGELTETPVLAIRHWCQECIALVLANEWGKLAIRQAEGTG